MGWSQIKWTAKIIVLFPLFSLRLHSWESHLCNIFLHSCGGPLRNAYLKLQLMVNRFDDMGSCASTPEWVGGVFFMFGTVYQEHIRLSRNTAYPSLESGYSSGAQTFHSGLLRIGYETYRYETYRCITYRSKTYRLLNNKHIGI